MALPINAPYTTNPSQIITSAAYPITQKIPIATIFMQKLPVRFNIGVNKI